MTAPIVTMHSKSRHTRSEEKLLSTHAGIVPSFNKEGIEAILSSVESFFRQGL